MSHIQAILEYVVDSFIHIWPYLLITIPIAVAVKMSGAANYINRAFTARPFIAIFLATAVGAFSPLCSCGVVPIIAAMLIGGVPLAPVMSFWLASPSMDPEIFFLTIGSLGMELAIWRLVSTLVLSLLGGFVTLILVQRNSLGEDFLHPHKSTQIRTFSQVFMSRVQNVQTWILNLVRSSQHIPVEASACCKSTNPNLIAFSANAIRSESISLPVIKTEPDCETTCAIPASKPSFWSRLFGETLAATTMVIKFMLMAWIIGAVVKLYIPQEWISQVLSQENPYSILTAAFLGVPVYTSNLAVMPLVGGLLALGMHPAAALAFLIAGPITTLPAMSAVWGLVNRKVFGLYLGFALVGAIVLGYVYNQWC